MTSVTRVQPEALGALKTEVLRKHGKLHGALLAEVTLAVTDRAEVLRREREERHG